jgi:hypothetical protein
MADLRQAAQQALEALEGCVKALDALHAPGDSIYTRASDSADRAEIALRAALAQEEQEPYCYIYEYDTPSGLQREFYSREYIGRKPDRTVPLYTHPPRREWQSLSEEEIEDLRDDRYFRFARAVEAALKEKNQ